MKYTDLFFCALLSIGLTLGTLYVTGAGTRETTVQPAQKETRLDQIKRTGILRCGYLNWPPFMAKDPTTGQLSGFFYELGERIGQELSVKIEWTAEINMGEMFADLRNNRYDVACAPFMATPGRAREGGFSIPIAFHPAYIYARADDTRFDNNYNAANDASVAFVGIDGEASSIIARHVFDKARYVGLPQLASGGDLYLNVANHKGDLVINEPFSFAEYNKNNQGKLRRVEGPALQISAVALPLPAKEPDLKEAIDITLTHLQGTGFIDGLFAKYEQPDAKFLHLVKPYAE